MLALLALARLPSLEQLHYCATGEWGNLLGLDRIPEVRTLRKKLAPLSNQQQAKAWSAELCAHLDERGSRQGRGIARRW